MDFAGENLKEKIKITSKIILTMDFIFGIIDSLTKNKIIKTYLK